MVFANAYERNVFTDLSWILIANIYKVLQVDVIVDRSK